MMVRRVNKKQTSVDCGATAACSLNLPAKSMHTNRSGLYVHHQSQKAIKTIKTDKNPAATTTAVLSFIKRVQGLIEK
jgi:hypothetical protein